MIVSLTTKHFPHRNLVNALVENAQVNQQTSLCPVQN
jgi:hypothetical protein